MHYQTLVELSRAAKTAQNQAAEAITRRDTAIREAKHHGITWHQIAQATGLSQGRIFTILKHPGPTDTTEYTTAEHLALHDEKTQRAHQHHQQHPEQATEDPNLP